VIERKYTPTSSDRQKGSFDIIIKVYAAGVVMPQFPDGGKMSQFMGRLKVGDTLGLSGPWGQIEYTAPGTFVHLKKTLKKSKVGMLAGGTGITPMLQILTAIFENPMDKTSCSLLYANKTEADILVRDMLEELAAKFPQRLTVHYTLDAPPAQGWKYSKVIDRLVVARLCLASVYTAERTSAAKERVDATRRIPPFSPSPPALTHASFLALFSHTRDFTPNRASSPRI